MLIFSSSIGTNKAGNSQSVRLYDLRYKNEKNLYYYA